MAETANTRINEDNGAQSEATESPDKEEVAAVVPESSEEEKAPETSEPQTFEPPQFGVETVEGTGDIGTEVEAAPPDKSTGEVAERTKRRKLNI